MNKNESMIKGIKDTATMLKIAGVATNAVSKIGAYALVNGAADFLLDKIGLKGFKRVASKIFVNTSLMTVVNEKICNYAYEDYIGTVNSVRDSAIKVLDAQQDGSEDEDEDIEPPFDVEDGEEEDQNAD